MNIPSEAIDWASYPPPVHLKKWVEENKGSFLPPVMNKLMYPSDRCQWKIMFVGGPNTRTDYHIEEGEEWFYQVKGDMVVKIVDDVKFKDVVIKEGQAYLHPPRVPHSPQRFENTVGLVIERLRTLHEVDGLRWYCPNPACRKVVFEKFFHCENLGTQLQVLINFYYANESVRTCKHCGTVDPIPQQYLQRRVASNPSPNVVVQELQIPSWASDCPAVDPSSHPPPFFLQDFIKANLSSLKPPHISKALSHPPSEFHLAIVGGPSVPSDYRTSPDEIWFWQLKGDMMLKLKDGALLKELLVRDGECYLLPANVPHMVHRSPDTLGLVLERYGAPQ